jgi:hypothetical protein
MNNTTFASNELKPQVHPKFSPQTYEGIYHSSSINKSPSEVYAFCQNEANINKVLTDLPEKIKNFLDLEFVSANSISADVLQVQWRNKKSAEQQGLLTFTFSPAPAKKGTVVVANAIFGEYSMDDEGPSDLINIFLKRVKSLIETNQIATTKGQPNGKDEEEINTTTKH